MAPCAPRRLYWRLTAPRAGLCRSHKLAPIRRADDPASHAAPLLRLPPSYCGSAIIPRQEQCGKITHYVGATGTQAHCHQYKHCQP